jgi:hypothetical protein
MNTPEYLRIRDALNDLEREAEVEAEISRHRGTLAQFSEDCGVIEGISRSAKAVEKIYLEEES